MIDALYLALAWCYEGYDSALSVVFLLAMEKNYFESDQRESSPLQIEWSWVRRVWKEDECYSFRLFSTDRAAVLSIQLLSKSLATRRYLRQYLDIFLIALKHA